MPKVAYTDGACRVSNPGQCSCAWVLYDGAEEKAWGGAYLGPELHSNNYAEYQGVLRLLRWLHEQKITDVVIHCDSKLVVNQINQEWSAENKPELKKFMVEAYGLLTVGHHRIVHVRGHGGNANATDNDRNGYADEICNRILDHEMERRGETYEKALS